MLAHLLSTCSQMTSDAPIRCFPRLKTVSNSRPPQAPPHPSWGCLPPVLRWRMASRFASSRARKRPAIPGSLRRHPATWKGASHLLSACSQVDGPHDSGSVPEDM
jgi:hypothetical protein